MEIMKAFARPLKPDGVDRKSAYLIGSGLASLAAATFLVRDAQMKGNRIHILEELALPGGSMDGIWNEQKGYIIRGGREMEIHFETLWDLFRSIPSLETGVSVLDEFYWLNKKLSFPCTSDRKTRTRGLLPMENLLYLKKPFRN